MTYLEKKMLVSVPSGIIPEGNSGLSVRLRSRDEDIPNLLDTYGERLFCFELVGDLLDCKPLIKALRGKRIRVYDSSELVEKAGANIKLLRDTNPVFILHPDADLLTKTNFLTANNFPVQVDPAIVPEREILLQTLDFYFHNRLLNVPIEPFHSSVISQRGGKLRSIWDISWENPINNFFVNDQGFLTLSRRWSVNGFYYGNLKDSWGAITRSEVYQRIISHKKLLFKAQHACVFCHHYVFCEGYFSAIEVDWTCDAWKAVFSKINSEVKKAKMLLNENCR
jgi:hypothetical protein